jgi:hypothetical protein
MVRASIRLYRCDCDIERQAYCEIDRLEQVLMVKIIQKDPAKAPDFRGRLQKAGIIKRQFRFTCFVTVAVSWVVIFASRETAADPPDWIDWNGEHFFEACRSDCSVSQSGGRQITTAMTRIMLIHNAVPAWEWHWGDAGIVDGEFSRRLVTFWHALELEPQIGIGKRFGDMQAVEF